jgi:hypothetical protein
MGAKSETEPVVKPIGWDGIDNELAKHRKNQLRLLNHLTDEAVKSQAWLYTDDFFRLLTNGEYDNSRGNLLRHLTRGFPTEVNGVKYAVTERGPVDSQPKLLGVGRTKYIHSPNDWLRYHDYDLPPVLGQIELNASRTRFMGSLCLTSMEYTAINNRFTPITKRVNGVEHPIIATVGRPTCSLGSINKEDSFRPTATDVHFGVDTALKEVNFSDSELIEENLQYIHAILDVFKDGPTFGGAD